MPKADKPSDEGANLSLNANPPPIEQRVTQLEADVKGLTTLVVEMMLRITAKES